MTDGTPEHPRRWTGHRPARLRHVLRVAALVALSAALQLAGAWQMQPFHHSPSSGNRPLWIYYAGFGTAVLAMFVVIGLFLRKQVVGITDDEIALGRLRCARRGATLRLRPWKRLVGRGTLLEIRSGPDVWRIGAPHRLPSLGGDTSGISPRKVDAVMSPLDFDEILSRLAVPEAPASIPGLRVDLVPFLRTAMGGLAAMKPFFVTVLVLAVLGPTLGPVVSRLGFGSVIMTPVVLLIVMSGVIRVFVSYHRPPKVTRLVIGAGQVTAMDLRSGATLASAPLPAVAFERFHFLLMGGRSEGITLRNRGLAITFPSGFTTSVAIPAFRPWPDPVKRRRAPRWTVDLDAAAQLLRVLRLSAAD